MNTALRAVLGAVISCAFLPAHAGSDYEASFQLDAMPRLRTGIAGYDTPDMLNGQWASMKSFDATISTREVVGTTVDPVTGAPVTVWGNSLNSSNRDRSTAGPLSFGMTYGEITGPAEWTQTTGNAVVNDTYLGTHATLREVPAEARGNATWNRDFWLEAGTTITFAGLATLGIAGDVPALDAAASFLGGNGQSFATLAFGDTLGRARVEIGATLSDLADGLTGVFAHTLGADGRLSLTITNTGSERLHGNLFAGAFIASPALGVTAPVPEPATWLMLLGGAALVGRVARRSVRETHPNAG